MLNDRELSAAIGSTAYGRDGEKIGTVEHFFVDDRTGAPTWVAVSTGLFGTRHSIVPADEATFADGGLRLPVSREAVRSAPHVTGTQHLDPAEEAELRRHYGLEASQPVPPAAAPAADAPAAPAPATEERAAQAPATEERAAPASDGAMTRGEEQLRVHTERVPATRVRLVKYVITEEVQVTVPIRREEIRVEEVPLDAPDAGPGESLVPEVAHAADQGTPVTGGAGSDADGGLPEEIVLHREEPVISVRVVPSERVRLRTELVQGQEQVRSELQRERIAVEQEPVVRR
jgi:stress response protein YsnF